MVQTTIEDSKHDISIVPEPSDKRLNERQLIDYEAHREDLIEWMLTIGKEPMKAKGYSPRTVRRRAQGLDRFYRWVWSQEGGYTLSIVPDHADDYLMEEIAKSDTAESTKANEYKALSMYARWREETKWSEWEPIITFSGSARTNPPDYLSREERTMIREASLDYQSVPSYNHLSPEERADWKQLLAQRLRKPVEKVTPEDFEGANSFKVPSIVWASLDAGLRPLEVGKARTSWVDAENELLRIPKEDSTKNEDFWIVAIQKQTAMYLRRWIQERETKPRYDDTDRLWLTRENNPYTWDSLRYLLKRLCEDAGIDYSNRRMSWYIIRHSTGTHMTSDGNLAQAADQLRHKDVKTTKKYAHSSAEERRDTLSNID